MDCQIQIFFILLGLSIVYSQHSNSHIRNMQKKIINTDEEKVVGFSGIKTSTEQSRLYISKKNQSLTTVKPSIISFPKGNQFDRQKQIDKQNEKSNNRIVFPESSRNQGRSTDRQKQIDKQNETSNNRIVFPESSRNQGRSTDRQKQIDKQNETSNNRIVFPENSRNRGRSTDFKDSTQRPPQTYVRFPSELNNINGQTTLGSKKNNTKQNNIIVFPTQQKKIQKEIFNNSEVYENKQIIIIPEVDINESMIANISNNSYANTTANIINDADENQKNLNDTRKLLPYDCGKVFPSRVSGGLKTEKGEFPWLVTFKFCRPSNRTEFTCAGALINSRYVVTVAHCINRTDQLATWKLQAVVLGLYNKSVDCGCNYADNVSRTCTNDVVYAQIEEEIIHENRSSTAHNFHNDIALLRLSKDVNFTDYIKPICLPEEPAPDMDSWVVGWGATENDSESDIPLKLLVPFVPHNTCQSAYTGRTVTNSQICAGGESKKDVCFGDSGGPLMQTIKRPNDTWRFALFGLVSYGIPDCGTDTSPEVYTDIHYYMPWILSKLRQ